MNISCSTSPCVSLATQDCGMWGWQHFLWFFFVVNLFYLVSGLQHLKP